MDEHGNIYLTEGEVPDEDRKRLEDARARNMEEVEARIQEFTGRKPVEPEEAVRRLRKEVSLVNEAMNKLAGAAEEAANALARFREAQDGE